MAHDPGKIGPFVIKARLGQGGMGLVFLGTDSTGRDAAVKVIQPALTADPLFRDRFLREARLLARVGGACTAQVLAADIDADPAYLAVEYVEGPTLQDEVTEHGPLLPELLRPLGVGLLEALAAIHASTVIHRDLKPANIILASDGPKVIDFGIARLADGTAMTTAGHVFGSPGWMAPEQFLTGEASSATDVFAWGATMAFACTGRAPYAAERLEAVYYNVLHAEPDVDGCPADLLPLVLASMAKDPQSRPTVSELLSQLAQTTDGTVSPTGVTLRILRDEWLLTGRTLAGSSTETVTSANVSPHDLRHRETRPGADDSTAATPDLRLSQDAVAAEFGPAPDRSTPTRPVTAAVASPSLPGDIGRGSRPAKRRSRRLAALAGWTQLAALFCIVIGVVGPDLTYIYIAVLLTATALSLLVAAALSRSGSP